MTKFTIDPGPYKAVVDSVADRKHELVSAGDAIGEILTGYGATGKDADLKAAVNALKSETFDALAGDAQKAVQNSVNQARTARNEFLGYDAEVVNTTPEDAEG